MLRIVIDTREQRPWSFPPDLAEVRIGTLRTGDYALVGDDAFAIERKSLDDFLGTVSTGWERFLREIGRMEGSDFAARVVIVEADFEACCFRQTPDGTLIPPSHNHPRLTPAFVARRIAELTMMGVSVLFGGCADYAAALAFALLKERSRTLGADDSQT